MIAVTDEQRQALGLTVRDTHRTPSPVPGMAPVIVVRKTQGRTAMIELQGEVGRRGKPPKVAGTTIFIAQGAKRTTLEGWQFATSTTRIRVEILFPPSEAGGQAWIAAFWKNSRDESGPAATPD